MPNRRRSSSIKSAPKLFRCTGYGNCDMVFTRSEHLARHERKHTGEKPYKCIVPGCSRMFSRFDNMMQHTQTHEKSKRNSISSKSIEAPKLIQREQPTPIKTEPLPPHYYTERPQVPLMGMVNSRTLPPPPPRRASIASSYNFSLTPVPPLSYYQNTPGNRNSWPIRREPPYYNSNNNSPEDYLRTDHRRSSTSTTSSESTLVSPVSATFPNRRRISIDDLRLPIEDLKNIQLEKKPRIMYESQNTVDITCDEFEALEGFSKFRTKSVIASPPELTPSPVMRSQSPNFASQVCAMRQRVMTLNESYSRG